MISLEFKYFKLRINVHIAAVGDEGQQLLLIIIILGERCFVGLLGHQTAARLVNYDAQLPDTDRRELAVEADELCTFLEIEATRRRLLCAENGDRALQSDQRDARNALAVPAYLQRLDVI